MRVLVATCDGVTLVENGRARETLPGHGVRCVAVDGETVWAGGSDGVHRSDDAGETWDHDSLEADVFSVAVGPAGAYAGTEPSALFHRGNDSWSELPALLELRSRPTWSFPPRPWTSHVRSIAPSPHDPSLVLVGIELGGLMRTTDGGASWADHRPGAQRDVHELAWHPSLPGRAYEAGGGGAAWSDDGGDSWHAADDGRDRHYTWALAVDPREPECWLVSASSGPSAAHGGGDPQAGLYRRRAGAAWELLDAPTHSMPYALDAADDGTLVLGLLNGELYASADRGDTWTPLAVDGAAPSRVAALALA